jgi:ABC-type lipoprotein export system ATPase subunit
MSMLELRQVAKVYGQGAAEVHVSRGVAAVVVTHDAHPAAWADRVAAIRDVRIVSQRMPVPGPESLLGQDR